jgi:hypothetical protein
VAGIPNWTVKTPHSPGVAVFEASGPAWEHASACCEAGSPSVLTHPDGGVFYVFRADDFTELSTRHRMVGTTRRVVEP